MRGMRIAGGLLAVALKPLLQQALPNVKGQTFTSVIVDFPPNARAMPHRHASCSSYQIGRVLPKRC